MKLEDYKLEDLFVKEGDCKFSIKKEDSRAVLTRLIDSHIAKAEALQILLDKIPWETLSRGDELKLYGLFSSFWWKQCQS